MKKASDMMPAMTSVQANITRVKLRTKALKAVIR